MRLMEIHPTVLGALALSLLPTIALAKPYPVHLEELEQYHNASQIEKRACPAGSTSCGYYGQICCSSGQSCYTDANNQAQCGAAGAAAVTTGWVTYTSIWVETVGLVTKTSVYSTYLGGAAAATPTAACGSSQQPCGSICCDSGFYCYAAGTCSRIAGGSSGGVVPVPAPTVTYTGSPTATVPFQTPIPTGATGGLVGAQPSNSGLSGGAIAGIVIGVLLGLLLLLLLCIFCCARALFDTILAIFGFGKKRRHTHEETYVEEHHHSSGGAAAGGRWYGRPSRPSRVGSEKKSGVGKGLGMAAALGGLALALGLKRKHDRRDDKSTTVSGSSYYYDYTSSSSASSDDRRTRNTRHSSRPSRR